MMLLIRNYWFYIALIALAGVSFHLAVKATRDREAKARADCAQQNGEMINYGRYTLCRVKGDVQ